MKGVQVTRFSGKLTPSVCGVGIVDRSTKNADGTRNKAYLTWKGILRRCYDTKQKCYVNYKGCTICAEWTLFSKFERWYEKHYRLGYDIDKDILVPGNKVYGPNVCCFVPQSVNKLLTARARARGPLPQGVTRATRDGKVTGFVATVHRGGKMYAIGWGQDPQELHEIYKKEKAAQIREVARAQYEVYAISKSVRDALFRIARDFSFVQEPLLELKDL